jgi:hypothetical protein
MGIDMKKIPSPVDIYVMLLFIHFTCWEGKKPRVLFLRRDTCAERKKYD